MIIESKNDPVLQEDLEQTARELSLKEISGSTVLITGATGLVGSQLVKTVACCNRVQDCGIRLILPVRNPEKAKKILGELADRSDINIVKGDVCDSFREYIPEDMNVDYIIHSASITASKLMVTRPVDTLKTSVNGTENMLDLAVYKNSKGFVYISSMEVYGSFEATNGVSPYVDETMLGFIDPLSIRSNYPESKRLCENMCQAYRSQFGLNVKIARLAQTFGAGILEGENRVFAQFARSAVKGEDIVLHTKGLSEGNYCYTADTVRGILTILLKGENGGAYNVANEDAHTTIADMARTVCEKIAEKDISVVFDIPQENTYGYAADTKMKLNSAKLRALGWRPHIGLEDAYRRMIKSMSFTGV